MDVCLSSGLRKLMLSLITSWISNSINAGVEPRAKSNNSWVMLRQRLVWWLISLVAFSSSSRSSEFRPLASLITTPAHPEASPIIARGLLISWATPAAILPISASLSIRTRSSWIFFHSVMSLHTPTVPTLWPSLFVRFIRETLK